MPRCSSCGKFLRVEPGVQWRMVYSGAPIPTPDHEMFMCKRCVLMTGGYSPQPGIKEEYSCGVFE